MISESNLSREYALSGRLAFIDVGTASANAALQIHSGTRPATANDATTDTLLVSVKLTSPAGSVADGALTLTPAEPGMVAATGVGTWARVVNRDGATVFDMDVGATGSTAECILTNTTLYAGGLVSVLSAVLG